MAYKKSRARTQLSTVYSEISDRLKLADRKVIDPVIREYVIAAAIFLAHAEIENFIEDIVAGFAQGIKAKALKGSSLPGNLRSHLFLTKANAIQIFGNYLAASSEKDLLKNFTTAMQGSAGDIMTDQKVVTHITGKDIYGSLKYPSEDNLKKLFFRLGINDLFQQLSAHLKQDAVALLKSLGSLRTQLAHTGTLPGISCKDVREKLDDAERFVSALDRLMYRITIENLGAAIWRKHLCQPAT
ncbi:hypothetical protein AWB70_00507 [Caballeronia cordobensis]|uniref:RiboL-PSP-HEPN domain-containing protein n=1 Tax=Caballeronia cordobensis TaxID=1353886 RepID=A0A158F3D8_CABCO|nr:HEPN domain-containing protein [Caballeronia cordobensis]SAL14163.1 hypothetical protein AWB70_00507 [Caballeronia cordobensis]